MRRLVFAPLISVLMLGAALTAAGAANGPAVPEHPRGEPAAATVDPAAAPSVADLPVVVAGPTVADSGIARASATTPAPAVDGTLPLVKPAADAAATDRPLRTMRLGCTRFVSDATGLAVGCRWSAVDVDPLRGYQLWRVVDAPGTRRLIATVPAGEPLRFVDRDVSRGHRYTYVVLALATDGSTLGRGGPVVVRIPAPDDVLRMGCELARIGDVRGVACKWSETDHPAAVRYVLYRSVDGGAREAIYRAGLDGRRSFLDREVKRGQSIRYSVVVFDKAGHVVGRGGPVVVRIPAPDDVLRMGCELARIGDVRGVACKWSETDHPAAVRYVLYRSVDGGAREAIYRAGLDGRRSFLDREVKRGQSIRYSVVVFDKAGHVVGRGGPVVVRIPAPDAAPSDAAPSPARG